MCKTSYKHFVFKLFSILATPFLAGVAFTPSLSCFSSNFFCPQLILSHVISVILCILSRLRRRLFFWALMTKLMTKLEQLSVGIFGRLAQSITSLTVSSSLDPSSLPGQTFLILGGVSLITMEVKHLLMNDKNVCYCNTPLIDDNTKKI